MLLIKCTTPWPCVWHPLYGPQPCSSFFLRAERPRSLSHLVQGKRDAKELPPPDVVVDVEAEEEVAEGVLLKRKKMDN